MRPDLLHLVDSLTIKVIDIVAKHIVQLGRFFCPPSILDIEINRISMRCRKDVAQHVEIHLVVPIIMNLIVGTMIQDRLVWNQYAAKAK